MEGDGAVEGSVPGPGGQGRQGGGHLAVVPAGDAGDPAGAQEGALHGSGPVLLLDLGEGPEFGQVMGVAGTVAHPLEGEAGVPTVMDDDAGGLPVETAAPGGDGFRAPADDPDRNRQVSLDSPSSVTGFCIPGPKRIGLEPGPQRSEPQPALGAGSPTAPGNRSRSCQGRPSRKPRRFRPRGTVSDSDCGTCRISIPCEHEHGAAQAQGRQPG